ncbi:MAG: hypothetical protein FD143_2783 [Ignavibacteria bacterium]|nr:MAG: hypothetical protein FD143_2783 [Ignavibacteria bacterium]KAF0158311.1 MAG: hypothetical protein FD188_2569 [Ignavibacteria bacterium]
MAEWLNAAVSKTVSRFFGTGVRIPLFPQQLGKIMKTIFALLFVSIFTFSQTENWILVSSEKGKSIYLNSVGLNIYQEGDIFLWVQEVYNDPLSMEEVEQKIFKVKSYFMISRELQKYSLVEVIYYDEDNNVIKSYRYNRDYDDPQFKYSSPIIKNTDMAKIFVKCEELIKQIKD